VQFTGATSTLPLVDTNDYDTLIAVGLGLFLDG